ncbi:MAG TPA: site-2 protease family protein [Chloroflexota bacterium]
MLTGSINWQLAIETIIVLLVAIDVHELAHAVVADALGDSTPRRLGELSLNPFVHMDQVGVVLLLVTSISGLGFTYGRTHVTPNNLRFGPQRGGALVAIAGPVSNIVLAVICGVVLSHTWTGLPFDYESTANQLLWVGLELNILLFILNLIPIPPLDGFTVLGGFLSARQMYSLAPLQQWGPIVILLLFVADPQIHILSNIIDPPLNSIFSTLCSTCVQ